MNNIKWFKDRVFYYRLARLLGTLGLKAYIHTGRDILR
jgi:hypothetical protein